MAAKVDPNEFTTPFNLTKSSHRNPYPFIAAEKPENSQEGKIIIITGGGSGIGAAAASVWARAHASGIVITGRRVSPLTAVEAELKAINPSVVVLVVEADISVEADVKKLFAAVQTKFGRPADVLLNNAAFLDDQAFMSQSVDIWWKGMETNGRGLAYMVHHFIATQPKPDKPVGTIISVVSGRVGLTIPNGSSYDTSKAFEVKLVEHLQLEHPSLRFFLTMPGIVKSDMTNDYWKQYAFDHAELTGLQALYLAQPRADYLKGSTVGVNWDLEEMEDFKEEIETKGLLKSSWLPILPAFGGKGLVKA